jgi:hypothetical protein
VAQEYGQRKLRVDRGNRISGMGRPSSRHESHGLPAFHAISSAAPIGHHSEAAENWAGMRAGVFLSDLLTGSAVEGCHVANC